MPELKKDLNITEVIFFGVGSILGAGIYVLIGKVAGLAGNMLWLAFLIASVAALLTSFAYAELSSMYPKAAGEYVYIKEAIGPRTAAFFGLIIALSGLISGAAVALGFGGYFSKLLQVPYWISAPGILFLLYLINVSGVKNSAAINVIFTLIEIGGLLFVIYASWPHLGTVNYFEIPEGGMKYVLMGSALSFYAYIGFEKIVKLIEETREGEKKVPKALFIANGIVMIIYTVVALCVVGVIPWQQFAGSDSPLTDVIAKRFGTAGIISITVIALFSTSNTILANMLGSSRVLFGMGKEIPLFKSLATLSEKRRTPVIALTLLLVVMCLVTLIGKIETVARLTNFFIFFIFISVNITVIILRFKQADVKRPFLIKGCIGKVPVLPVAAILITLVLLVYNISGLSI
jgi:basic amino acid/polyamine antiporter, APA family